MSCVSRSFHVRAAPVALILLLISGSVAEGQRLGAPAGSVQATETPSTTALDEAQLRDLIGTLEDPVKRDELLTNLRALLAAQRAAPTPETAPEDPLASAAEVIAQPAELVGSLAEKVVGALQRLPLFVSWLEQSGAPPSGAPCGSRSASIA